MYVVIVDQAGVVLVERNMKTEGQAFLQLVAPYREDLVVAVECIFTWYWLADLCAKEGIAFVLGHALYMKAIHGGKAKNDKIDAHKIAALLRGGLLPQAYVYPPAMRSTRDVLRRRLHLVRKRAELLSHIINTNSQCNLPDFGGRINYKVHRTDIAQRFDDPSVRKSIEVDLELIEHYDALIQHLELYIVRTAKSQSCASQRNGSDVRRKARQPLRLIGHPLCLRPDLCRAVVGPPGDSAPHPNLQITDAHDVPSR